MAVPDLSTHVEAGSGELDIQAREHAPGVKAADSPE